MRSVCVCACVCHVYVCVRVCSGTHQLGVAHSPSEEVALLRGRRRAAHRQVPDRAFKVPSLNARLRTARKRLLNRAHPPEKQHSAPAGMHERMIRVPVTK